MAILVARTNLPVWDFQKLASLEVIRQFVGQCSLAHSFPLLFVCTSTEQLAASPTISLCSPSIYSPTNTHHSNRSIISANSLPLPATVLILTVKLPTLSDCPNAAQKHLWRLYIPRLRRKLEKKIIYIYRLDYGSVQNTTIRPVCCGRSFIG